MYNQRKTNTKETLTELNKQQPYTNFTMEKELHNSINFLDLLIHLREKEFEFTIYRKPTETDIIIPNDSCHPHKYKISSIKVSATE
jgi:hypothetical protein